MIDYSIWLKKSLVLSLLGLAKNSLVSAFSTIIPSSMDEGMIVEKADTKEFFANPKSERTKLFLSQIL